MRRLRSIPPAMFVAALALGAGAAGAQELKGWTGPKPVVACECRYQGGRAQLGEEVCLSVGGRSYVARCEKVLNNTSWEDTGQSCSPPDPVSVLDWLERFAQLR